MRKHPLAYVAFALLSSACSPDDGSELESAEEMGMGTVDGNSATGSGGAGLLNNSGGTQSSGGALGSDATPGSGGAPGAGGNGSEVGSGGDSVGSGGAGDSGSGSGGLNGDLRPALLEGYGEKTTGGLGGNTVTATTGTEIHQAICNRAADDTPLIILVNGTITPGNTTKQSGSCDTADGVIELKNISNISLIGVNNSAIFDQVGIHVRTSSNVILQNLTIKNVRKSNTSTPSNGGDAIGMESDVNNVWVDHNTIHGSTTEGEEHDGLLDFKDGCTNITVSYNHLHTSGRGGLIGSSDSGTDGSTNFSFHHNWYDNLNSRTHLVREAQAHFYNNYYSNILSSGLNVRNGATILVEGNYFTEAVNPLGTFFYLEGNPVYEVNDNFFDTSVVWESTADQIPAGPAVQSTGSVSVPYQYSLDPVASVPAIVMANAGAGKL